DRPPILLGKDLASELGVAPGDLVRLFVQTTTLTPMGPVPRPMWLRVAGVMDAGFYEYNAIRAYVPLETARRVFHVSGANEVEIRVRSLAKIDDTQAAVESA